MTMVVTSTSNPESAVAVNASLATSDKPVETTVSDDKPSDEKVGESETPKIAAEHDDSENVSDDSDEVAADEGEQQEKPKAKNGFKKKIGKLQSERDHWKSQYEQALKGQPQPQEQKAVSQKPVVEGKPKPEDFDNYSDYQEALVDYKIELRDKARAEHESKVSAQTEYQKVVQTYQQKIDEFKKTKTDFDDVVADLDDYQASPAMTEAILTSEPEVLYELAKNPKELDRLNSLSPTALFREIGKLEAKLAKYSSSPAEKQVKTTNAPPPIKPVGTTSAAAGKKSIFDADLSQAEYEALRRKKTG